MCPSCADAQQEGQDQARIKYCLSCSHSLSRNAPFCCREHDVSIKMRAFSGMFLYLAQEGDVRAL